MINKISKIINPSQLRQAPLGKLPDKLIWHRQGRLGYHDFVMFSTSNSNHYAKMTCRKTKQYMLSGYSVQSLFIHNLISNTPNKGLGTEMLKLAHKFSKQIGCEGRFFLSADGIFEPFKVPHIFYRKFGMNTEYPQINKKLDKFIKKGKNGTIIEFPHVRMYYPPIEEIKDKNTFSFKKSALNMFTSIRKFIYKYI